MSDTPVSEYVAQHKMLWQNEPVDTSGTTVSTSTFTPPITGGVFSFRREVPVTTFAKPSAGTPSDALVFVRRHRHHPDCRCGTWRDGYGAPFCTPAEALWSRALDRLLNREPPAPGKRE